MRLGRHPVHRGGGPGARSPATPMGRPTPRSLAGSSDQAAGASRSSSNLPDLDQVAQVVAASCRVNPAVEKASSSEPARLRCHSWPRTSPFPWRTLSTIPNRPAGPSAPRAPELRLIPQLGHQLGHRWARRIARRSARAGQDDVLGSHWLEPRVALPDRCRAGRIGAHSSRIPAGPGAIRRGNILRRGAWGRPAGLGSSRRWVERWVEPLDRRRNLGEHISTSRSLRPKTRRGLIASRILPDVGT